MASRFQEAALVSPPSHPDAIAWSAENLIAVASSHLVTILNPALPSGPRGLITIPNAEPYKIGVVRREDLLTGGLLPFCLKRDRRPCVRSLSWSDIGMSPNYGCLLAVCTAEGRVKLYRPPYCDFRAEWIEIADLSDMLYEYLSSINFWESDNPCTVLSKERVVEHDHEDDEWNSVLNTYKRKRVSRNKIDLHHKNYTNQPSSSEQDKQEALDIETNKQENNSCEAVSESKARKKVVNKTPSTCPDPVIRAEQYVSRDASLSSLSVAWSSLLRFSSETCSVSPLGPSHCFSLLAVGSKSGRVSLWKVHPPECYYLDHGNVSLSVALIGILHAHSSWILTLSWAIIGSDSSDPQVLLVTGSCDGSVKIWVSDKEDLLKSSEVNKSSFALLKQVITANPVPVSTLSLVLPTYSPNVMHLAIGKGSGSFEVWMCNISNRKFEKVSSCVAHDLVVTGLAWAFDGRCLYSCSQDNYVRNWTLHDNTISEVPIPANTPGLCSAADLPDEFLSCLGVALSPGNLAVALVRSFNVDLLNPMYQARSQKAGVEFLWNGAQQSVESDDALENIMEAFPGFSKKELSYWDSNFLWSLKKFEDVNKPLAPWDIIAAMLAFKRSTPEFVEYVVTKWLTVSYFLGSRAEVPTEELLPEISKSFSRVPSRLLHILNVISRRVMLSELKTDQINNKLQNLRTNNDAEDEEQLGLWLELLQKSERELRERLVALSFSFSLIIESRPATVSSSPGHWGPVGLAQMKQWVKLNQNHVRNQLKILAPVIKSHGIRSDSTETPAEEKCCYCPAPVHFDSPEQAFCQAPDGNNNDKDNINKVDHRHKLERCSVSMQVCPATPSWFCKCCQRWTSKLPPETLFTMPSFPSDLKSLQESSLLNVVPKPFCPFCGIVLQRRQPEFLLSASPV